MRILVTGAAGFIGSNIVDELLKAGYDVIGLDAFRDYYPRSIKERNIENALENDSFRFIEGDILDVGLPPSVDYVIHEAAQAGVRSSWGRGFDIYLRDNILVTQRLLEFYKGSDIKKFVYASSSSVYGDSKLPMREDGFLNPVSPYGVTKLAGENLCYLYYKNYGVPVSSLRYFTVYGPRQRPDMAINKFTSAILDDKEVFVFGDGGQKRDFTYVSDVVAATISAMASDISGEVFNIGGGSQISVNDLIHLLEKECGKEAKVCYKDKEKGDVNDTYADVSKADVNIGWKPRVSVSEGVRRYVDWIRE